MNDQIELTKIIDGNPKKFYGMGAKIPFRPKVNEEELERIGGVEKLTKYSEKQSAFEAFVIRPVRKYEIKALEKVNGFDAKYKTKVAFDLKVQGAGKDNNLNITGKEWQEVDEIDQEWLEALAETLNDNSTDGTAKSKKLEEIFQLHDMSRLEDIYFKNFLANELQLKGGAFKMPKLDNLEVDINLKELFFNSDAYPELKGVHVLNPTNPNPLIADEMVESPADPIVIADWRTKTKLIVDECGAKAAAVAVMIGKGGGKGLAKSPLINPPMEVVMDRPFIFGVRSPEGTLINLGIINDPELKSSELYGNKV